MPGSSVSHLCTDSPLRCETSNAFFLSARRSQLSSKFLNIPSSEKSTSGRSQQRLSDERLRTFCG